MTSWDLDPASLDQDDPFEIDDDNRAHLAKHPPYTEEDVYDVFFEDPVFVDAPHEPAIWLMIGPVPGDFLVVPCLRAQRVDQLRPIGVYRGGQLHMEAHERGRV